MKNAIPIIPFLIIFSIAAASPLAAQSPTDAERQLADALVLSARVDELPEDLPAHLRRTVVLARLALRLDPENRLALLALAEAGESTGDLAVAADAMNRYSASVNHRDYQSFVRWVRYSLATLPDLESRLAFLASIADDEALNPPGRALAMANMAVLEENRGNSDTAIRLYRQALALDQNQSAALIALQRLQTPMPPQAQAKFHLALLRGNPLALAVAYDIARLCQNHGLHAQAMLFYDYCRDLAAAANLTTGKSFQIDYFNALLDAGLAERAVAEFGLQDNLNTGDFDPAIASLLAEAYREIGQQQHADEIIHRMTAAYEPRRLRDDLTAAAAAELAWFDLLYRQQSAAAEKWAAAARRLDPDDPYVQRVWAIVQLQAGREDQALPVLQSLADRDVYAATSLVRYALKHDDLSAARGHLKQLDRHPRTGPGWRRLLRLASERNLSVPDNTDALPLAETIAAFEPGYLQMGRYPEKFIAASFTPVNPELGPGQPIEIRATLTNIGHLPVPLGEWGLLTPRAVLRVRWQRGSRRLEQLAHIDWPAPRYLYPNESLSQIIRLDVGASADMLARNPLSEVEILVLPTLDPLDIGRGYASTLKSVHVQSAQLIRRPLLDQDDPQAYYDRLIRLTRLLKEGDQLQAMRAADIIVSLLLYSQQVAEGAAIVTPKLKANLREPELLSMLRHCLQESSPIIQTHTLGRMQRLRLTELMVNLLAPSLNSPAPLVRARAVELLGLSRQPQHVTVLDHLAQSDEDELVRAMAEILTPPAGR